MLAGHPKRPVHDRGRPTPHLETELLLCCARTSLSAPTAARLRELVHQPVNWDLLRLMALAHRVGPLLYRSLRGTSPESVPAPALMQLRSDVRAIGRRNLLLTGRLLRLLAAFNERGIRVIPFKGPVIAVHVYGDLALRPFGDIDVLVHERDAAAAKALLTAQGFEQRMSHPWEAPFEDSAGVSVDLHWGIAPNYDPTPRSFDQLWRRAVHLPLQGTQVPTLAPEDLLLVLSIQIVKDWRESGHRLLQICDTAELLRRYSALDWTQIRRLAQGSGGERILQLDLLLAHDLLAAPVPDSVLRTAQASRPARALANELQDRMFPLPTVVEPPPDNSLPPRGRPGFYMRTRERWRDKMRYFVLRGWSRVGLAIRPSRSDREFMPLPRRLGFLYYLVRLVRVASRWVRGGKMTSKAESERTAPT